MTYTYESHIWSEEEALKFYNTVLRQLKPDEADFFCVAARKKYMPPASAAACRLGDTCMMGKTVLKKHNGRKFLSKLHQLDASLDWFLPLDDTPLPRSCMCIYMNLNHTSVPKAVLDFKKELAEYDFEFSMATLRNTSDAQAVGKLAGIHNRLLKAFQDPKNRVDEWTDIDMDIAKTVDAAALRQVVYGLEKSRFLLPVIETQGGYHVLISRSEISAVNKALAFLYSGNEMKRHALTVERILNALRAHCQACGTEVKEISINQNRMVPLPGTMQNGFPVRMHI